MKTRKLHERVFPWSEYATATLETGDSATLTIRIPDAGDVSVVAGPDGLFVGIDSIDTEGIWNAVGQNFSTQKEIYWHIAAALTAALEWAREADPRFPEVVESDWQESDFDWVISRDGLLIRIGPDGLSVVADPFGA